MTDINLALDVSAVALPEANATVRPLIESGYRFFTLLQAGDDETTRRRLYALVKEGVCDTTGFTGEFESYPAFMERIYTPSYKQHADSQFLATYADDWVGLSSFVQKAEGRGLFGLTVVTRAHRGRGIARALKLLALEYAQSCGVHTIVTENHPENVSILGLNRALGFREAQEGVR